MVTAHKLHSKSHRFGGFTIIEMLISLAIFISLSTYFIINYNSVNSRITLDMQAHEVALWIREAQAYAMGIRPLGAIFTPTYGVYFDADSANSGTFIMYVDRFDSAFNLGVFDKRYNPRLLPCGDPNSECIKQVPLPRKMTISSLVFDGVTPATKLDISFTRPNVDARIQDTAGTTYNRGDISIASPRGDIRKVVVIDSGQIVVE